MMVGEGKMEEIKQTFNPALRLCNPISSHKIIVKERFWTIDMIDNSSVEMQNMGYIGRMQIEEVWKHYYKEYYLNNYGYVVKIADEDAEIAKTIIPQKLSQSDENSEGMRWVDFSEKVKELFRRNAYIPKNRMNSGNQVCMNITGNTAEYDIHRIVAKLFLIKPDDFDNEKYVVHHIDNNSYNNSVTNLIYMKSKTHLSEHRKLHPLSY